MTLDKDVAAALERLRRRQDISLREAANRLLREGLQALNHLNQEAQPDSDTPLWTDSVDLGACLIGDLADVVTALAVAELRDRKN